MKHDLPALHNTRTHFAYIHVPVYHDGSSDVALLISAKESKP